jgi:hypothetical protein
MSFNINFSQSSEFHNTDHHNSDEESLYRADNSETEPFSSLSRQRDERRFKSSLDNLIISDDDTHAI